ncbi:hypothetical protein DRO31_06025 [Candidatus Bathyarchaeota archaeon]|nr:MAG: hypothetical protein DRO31_06025 [Candidatus Bathyarchaeota archaeon]
MPIGVFYREERPGYEHNFPVLEKGPLVDQSLERDLDELFKEYM